MGICYAQLANMDIWQTMLSKATRVWRRFVVGAWVLGSSYETPLVVEPMTILAVLNLISVGIALVELQKVSSLAGRSHEA